MKYGGTVLILDDEGNTMHERELTADEMIEELLHARTRAAADVIESGGYSVAPVITEGAAPARAPRAKKADKKERKPRSCSQCGRPGHIARHCEKASAPAVRKTEAEPLTEEEFDFVKSGKKEGISSGDVAKELGLDVSEVNKAWSAVDYDWYIEHR